MVGEYIGHTAQKTREQIRNSLGGILFLDEAYSLGRGGDKDFGKEAIDTLVKAMEDHKDNLIVILAGYKDEMDWFLQINPGLRSRFPIQIEFNDYSVEELMKIAKMMVEKRQYKFSNEALLLFENLLHKKKCDRYYDKLGNARLVRNMIERAIRRQALRLVNQRSISREDLLEINLRIFGGGFSLKRYAVGKTNVGKTLFLINFAEYIGAKSLDIDFINTNNKKCQKP